MKALHFLLLIVLSLPASAQSRDECFGALCVMSETRGGATVVTARNVDRVAPISLALTFRLRNMVAEGTGQAVLGPGDARQVAVLRPKGPGTWLFRYDYSWVPGDFRARPDPAALYELPFRGAAFRIAQSCGGWFSHRGESAQAIDFVMPIGTPVRAARPGRVIVTRMDSQRGGASPAYADDDNKVLVQHRDGSVAAYAHLSYRSAKVVPGQSVVAGDVLALSGNTGYSARPHLHFEVYTPVAGGGRRSWPVRWHTGRSVVICPPRGTVLRN